MYFQAPAIQLLDAIYQATHDSMVKLDPESLSNAYLKVLLEPLSTEARVWANSNFDHFGDQICYEIFRPLEPDDSHLSPTWRRQCYLETSSAITFLLGRRKAIRQRKNASARRLNIVFQAPHELRPFLNLYIAIAGNSKDAISEGLQSAIEATRHVLKHYDPYYYINN